jgi:hypothetical protein
MSIGSSPIVVVHIVSKTPWWDAQLLISAVTLLSVVIAQVVLLRIERERSKREEHRRQEQDATRAVARFLGSVADINPGGGEEAMIRIRSEVIAMDVYLNDALAESAEDVVIAAAKLVYGDDLSGQEASEEDPVLMKLRGRLELAKAAHKFHNDFRVSRSLPARNF